jgi:hypothetical protein
MWEGVENVGFTEDFGPFATMSAAPVFSAILA